MEVKFFWVSRKRNTREILMGLLVAVLLSALAVSGFLVPLVLPTLSVLIDPGHGGKDPGAVGRTGVVEKTITLHIAEEVNAMLRQVGVTTQMTRNTDERLEARQRSDLLARVRAASQIKVDIMVSIHVNSFRDQRVRGPRTYYQPGSKDGQRLAACIQNRLRPAAGYGNTNPTAEDHLITRATPMTAVIVEVGYISNPTEEQLLNTAAYRKKMASAIVQGILDCYPNP